MHLAETREQARKEAESGILGSLVGYIESLTGKPLAYGSDAALAVELVTTANAKLAKAIILPTDRTPSNPPDRFDPTSRSHR